MLYSNENRIYYYSSRQNQTKQTDTHLEEAQFVFIVGDQHVLGVAVVLQHHLVGLTAEARLLVAPKGRVRWIRVVAVHPHAARLDGSGHLVLLVRVSGPHARPQAVDGVVGDLDGLFGRLERGH